MEQTTQVPQPWPEGGEHGTFPVHGGRIMYHLYGKEKTGTPLVFLHGGPGGNCARSAKQIPLSDEHPVLFYNQLGSSGSDFSEEYDTAEKVKELLTIEHYVDEVEEVIKHFGFREFIVVGSSWGTMLAVEYAAAKQPEGLKALVLTGPFLSVDTWIGDAERLIKSLPDGEAMWQEVCRCEASGEYSERYQEINKLHGQNFGNRNPQSREGIPTEPEPKRVEGLSVYNHMWGPSEFSCTGTLRGHDSTKLLKDIHVPILYICGQYDSGSPQAAFYYQSKTANGEVCVLPGCGHSSASERPVEYNAILREFARRVRHAAGKGSI